MTLEPTGRDDLVDQLDAAAARSTWWWPVARRPIDYRSCGLALAPSSGCWPYQPASGGICTMRLTALVLFYDVHDKAHSWFDMLVNQWGWLRNSQRLWRIVSPATSTAHITSR